MSVNRIDPLNDPRWRALLERHPAASVFHTPEWLNALNRAYGYKPVVYGNIEGDELTSGIVFCSVNSWLTGSRLVSLPFSDHCQPLIRDAEELSRLLSAVEKDRRIEGWKYIELRPWMSDWSIPGAAGFAERESAYLHTLDLAPDLETIFRTLHRNQVQRTIHRAERVLNYEEGATAPLLDRFYELQVLTRRRHRLPPQPMAWFRSLVECLGGTLKIRMASRDGQPVASIITLHHKNTMTYKYGCSDPKFNNCGGTCMLLWNAIREAKSLGAAQFDFGRSDLDNLGLITFKDHWGTARLKMTYYRSPAWKRSSNSPSKRIAEHVFSRLPDRLLATAGTLLYRHVG